MRPRTILAALAVATLASCVDPADRKACATVDPATRIRGCTAVIPFDKWDWHMLAQDYANRSGAYLMQHREELALGDASRAVELDPALGEAYLARGAAYERKGLHDLAIADLSTALPRLRVQQNLELAYLLRSYARSMKGQDALAEADFARVVAFDPRDDAPYIDRSVFFLKNRRYDRVLADSAKAIALKPGDAEAYNLHAWALHLKGEDAAGLPDAEKAVALAPRDPASLETRAEIYERLGHRDKALADYRASNRLAPRMREAREGLQRLQPPAR